MPKGFTDGHANPKVPVIRFGLTLGGYPADNADLPARLAASVESGTFAMIDPEALTRDRFLEELRERVDALRLEGVEVPARLDQDVLVIVGGGGNPFDHELFRMAAVHLLDGLDPEMAEEDGGVELLEERLCALPANLGVSLRIAAERHEQHV